MRGRTVFTAILFVSWVIIAPGNADPAVGTATIRFANVPNQCINTNTSDVDFWITSMKITKEETWFTDTDGVGAKADASLFSNENGTRKFPLAQAIDTHDDAGKIVRANLSFAILSQYTFPQKLKIARLDVPLILIRRKGDSDVAKYAKAMIAFTKNASSAVPANPYAGGVELAAQIADSFFATLGAASSNDQYDPDFQIAFTLAKRASCTPQDLHDDVQAKIRDYSKGGVSNIIQTSEAGNYCFYKVGSDQDPDIGYVSKPAGGQCPAAVPATFSILNNPQVIYAAWGIPRTETAAVAAATPASKTLSWGKTSSPSVKTPNLLRAAKICRAANLSVDQCFKPRVAAYLKASK